MDSYVKAITLDVNADENYTIIKAKQGDKINRKIAITLKKDGANFTPTGVSQIWFRVQKPDKNIAIVKSTDSGNPISSAGNVYTVTLSEQCLTASGKAWCDLAFLDSSGNTLSSCAFILNIIPMPNGNTARSISEWTDLQQAIDDAERFASIVAFRTSGNYIQYTVDGTTWVNLTTVGAIGGDLQTQINALNGAINHKLDVYTTTTSSGTGVPTDAEIISSIALNGEAHGTFVARFDLSNGNTAFAILWEKVTTNYASGIGFGYYEESGYLLRKYQYSNGTLNTFDVYTSITDLQSEKQNILTFDSTPTSGSLNPVTSGGVYTALNTPETITLNASTMTFPSGVSFHQASENTITKIGKVCELTYSIKMTNVTSSDALNISNFFPIGYRPNHIYKSVGETGLGDGKAQPILVTNENSTFRIFPVNTGTTYAIGSITYICE